MVWKPTKILTFDSKTQLWSKTEFSTFLEYKSFITSMWKTPGEYNFKNTHYWRAMAIKYEKDKRYCDYHENSKDYKNFWLNERRKCEQGVIFDGVYVSGFLYFYWNFCRIVNKLEARETFPEIWDSLYHYDLYIHLAWLNGQDVAGTKARQKGLEQPNSELVLTELGWKSMGDIKVGDFVYTPKGTLTEVIDVFPQGVKDVYEVELLDGRKVRCGENHLWPVRQKTNKKGSTIKILSTKDIIKKGITYNTTANAFGSKKEYKGYTFSLPEIEPVEFVKKDLKIPPYVLGCLLGDGSTNKTSVQICSSDTEIFDEILKELGEDYYYGNRDQTKGNNSWRYNICYKYRFNDTNSNNEKFENYKYGVNPLIRYLKEYNLHNSNCYNKYIPKDYLFSDKEDRLALLQGLMDTDGYVNNQGVDYHFTTVSEQLANDVAHLSRSLGINTVIDKFNKAKESHSNYYRVRIKPKFLLFRLKRKLERQLSGTSKYRTFNSIKNITKLDYQEESTCIMVEDKDHLYLTRDFIPTHNSLYHMSRLTKLLWFGNRLMLKVISHEENYIIDEWAIMQGYRNFINENTGFYRTFSPDETLNWEQKREVTQGTVNKRKIFKGNKSKIKGLTTKMNITKAVGGAAYEIYVTEAGINPKLKKIKEYVDPNIKMGNVKTGLFLAMGSVGELKDAEPLMDMCFNPKGFNIRPIKDIFSGSEDDIAFFWPEKWSFVYEDEDTGEIIKCYDSDGNSNIQLAEELINKEEERQKRIKDAESFKVWKSQHPKTLQDAFDQREDNPFPTDKLKEQEFLLLNKKPILIDLERDINGKIVHKFSNNVPVTKLKPNPLEDNRGCIIVNEFPIDKPPFGLYYAGVDPIFDVDTQTSRSLMSISIWIGTHERDGKIVEPYPVASYTGRHKDAKKTYQVVLDLIKWYNARTAVECNVKDFIEWVIKQNDSRYLMRRRELTVIGEMMPNSTINDEIGVRMEGKFKDRALEKYIMWMNDKIATRFNMETGEAIDVYNTSKVFDSMLIKECLRFDFKRNTDRIVANLLGLIAAQTDTNRHIITSIKNPFEQKPKQTLSRLPSSLRSQPIRGFGKMSSPFTKRLN